MNEVNATPHTDLIAELMNPNIPKNDREHAAVREIERLREALAQPEQEPVKPFAWANTDDLCADTAFRWCEIGDHKMPVYTTPPQRTWVGLTEQEHTDIAFECGCMSADWVFYGAAVERKVKEKNK